MRESGGYVAAVLVFPRALLVCVALGRSWCPWNFGGRKSASPRGAVKMGGGAILPREGKFFFRRGPIMMKIH